MGSHVLDIQEALVRERLDVLAREAADNRLMVDAGGSGGSARHGPVDTARRWLGRSISAVGSAIEGTERRDESGDTAETMA